MANASLPPLCGAILGQTGEIAIIDTFTGAQLDLALAAQMWYMQPCLPDPEARHFSRALRV
jgi:hypothetical protein